MILTKREQIQLVAALELWASVAKHSRTHPADLPQIRRWFKNELPMVDEDVDVLKSAVAFATKVQAAGVRRDYPGLDRLR